MNLVKAQEYAQSLPLAELKKYADGLNPSMIPPWLATGEMQAKTKRAEMANALQGAATGEQPSVKEQVEQKAGLLGLQMAQQRASQQQMMEPRPMRGPVPTGTPQPEAQPQGSGQTFMAAKGGLARLPAQFNFDGGGIVAFAGKGPSKVINPDAGFWDWLQATSGLSKEEFIASPQKTKNNILEMFRSSEGVTPPPSAQAAQATQAAQGAPSGAFQAGQKASGALNAAKNMAKGKLLPGANVGLAAYEGLSDISGAQGFYDDPNVSMAEKAKQFARTGSRTALPVVGGAIGSGVAPIAGTVAGAAAGTGLAALIDQEGDALKQWRRSQQGGRPTMANDPRLNPNTDTTPTGPGANKAPGLPSAVPPQAAKPPAVPQNVNPNAVKVNPNAPAVGPEAAPAAANNYDAMLLDALKNKPKERSIESIIAEQQAIQKGLGLDELAGKNKLDRIAEIKQQYAATQLSPMDELIAMLGKSGQSKGLSGLAPAYTSMAEKKRAADLAHAERINELMGGVEDTQRAEKVATAGKVGTSREKDIENARLFDREAMQTMGTARGQDVQAGSSKYSADMHYKAAMAQIRSTAAREGMQQQRLLLDTFKTELATIDRELAPLLKAPFGPAKAQIAELQARKAGLTKALDEASGISKMLPAPGVKSPGGTPADINALLNKYGSK
jgi:hypothetical protein